MRRVMPALAALVAVSFVLRSHEVAASVDIASSDLTNLSLENLMEIEVTSVSKRPQSLSEAAAAIFVLTGDEILRSGARTIPDALRLVPGVSVSNLSSSSWAVSARGFGGQFSNKLLVLIDGRTIYTPLFSGVFWDRQYPILDNIERIEVVRGPGGALWGSNAVNGVINIITKNSADTQGEFARAGTGTDERYGATVRHGGSFGNGNTYRLTVNSFDRPERHSDISSDGGDDWTYQHVALRSDLTPSTSDDVKIHGEFYRGEVSGAFREPSLADPFFRLREEDSESEGASLNARWTHDVSNEESFSMQAYYDYAAAKDVRLDTTVHTFDFEAQHNVAIFDSHELVWGIGARTYLFDTDSTDQFLFTTGSDDEQILNAFIQDTYEVIPEIAYLTFGTKLEHNTDTGLNLQPSVRGTYHVNDRNTVWGAVSRAVRTPSLGERYAQVDSSVVAPFSDGNPTPFPTLIRIVGNDRLVDEKLTAYEAGVRSRVDDDVTVDVAAFFNEYRNLVSAEIGNTRFSAVGGNHLQTDIELRNDMRGYSYGTEISATADISEDWQLQASYSFLRVNLELADTVNTNLSLQEEDASPRHQAVIRSGHVIDADTRLDIDFRYVSRRFATGVDGYLVADARLSHNLADGLEIAVTGRNLAFNDHLEFSTGGLLGTEPTRVPRSVFIELKARF